MEIALSVALLIVSLIIAIMRNSFTAELLALWAIAVAIILRGVELAIK
jgi:hypothetical protein